LFSVVFAHPPSLHSSVSLLSVISLLLTNTESRTERLRGNQKKDERGPLSSLLFLACCSVTIFWGKRNVLLFEVAIKNLFFAITGSIN
jgi:hypothetical protein